MNNRFLISSAVNNRTEFPGEDIGDETFLQFILQGKCLLDDSNRVQTEEKLPFEGRAFGSFGRLGANLRIFPRRSAADRR